MDQKYFFMLKEIYETNPAKRNQMNIILKEKFTQFSPNGMIALYESIIEMKSEGVVFETCKKRKSTITEVLLQVDQYKIDRKQTKSSTLSNSNSNSMPNTLNTTCKFVQDYSNTHYSNYSIDQHETNPLKRRLCASTSPYSSNESYSAVSSHSASSTSPTLTQKKRKLSPSTCPPSNNVFETFTHYSTSSVDTTHSVHYNLPQFNQIVPFKSFANQTQLQLQHQQSLNSSQKLPSMRELMNSIMYSSTDGSSLLLKKVFE